MKAAACYSYQNSHTMHYYQLTKLMHNVYAYYTMYNRHADVILMAGCHFTRTSHRVAKGVWLCETYNYNYLYSYTDAEFKYEEVAHLSFKTERYICMCKCIKVILYHF